MTILQAILLGAVQGLTEFIPISSSAHLVLVRWLFNWPRGPEAFAFDVLVQVGTLVAVFAYFWRDLALIARSVLEGLARRRPLATPEARLGWWVALATVPAVAAGLLLKDFFEGTFDSAAWTAAQLVLNGLVLIAAERLTRGRQRRGLDTLNAADAAVIGLAQAAAILPGISRSGSTIAGALVRGLERQPAARFSFLMSVPVMLGAGVIAAGDLVNLPGFGAYLLPIAVGFVVSAVVGYGAIRWLLGYLGRHSMEAFGAYCLVAGAICLAIALVR